MQIWSLENWKWRRKLSGTRVRGVQSSTDQRSTAWKDTWGQCKKMPINTSSPSKDYRKVFAAKTTLWRCTNPKENRLTFMQRNTMPFWLTRKPWKGTQNRWTKGLKSCQAPSNKNKPNYKDVILPSNPLPDRNSCCLSLSKPSESGFSTQTGRFSV